MSLNPADFKWVDNNTIYKWRRYLKAELLRQRHFRSDWSGKSLLAGCHMHEGIITRATVPKSVRWHFLIYHPYNSILLLPEEHSPQPPSREWCIEKAYERYGEVFVKEWFYGLPFKVIPFELP